MKTGMLLAYIAVMAGVTYLIRMLPLTVFQKKIKNRFIRSFLYYIPYAVLGAMTFPAIPLFDGVAFILRWRVLAVAMILAFLEKSLLTVALCSCAAVFLAELLV